MASFNVALLIILIGFGFNASSVRADEHQNQKTTAIGAEFSLAKLEKQIENGIRDNHKDPSLMKNNSTLAGFHFHSLPIYQWNASDCHPEIVINERTNAIRRMGERDFSFCSCRAGPIEMPSSAADRIGIIYTEYRILSKNGRLCIGLSTKEMPLDKLVGTARVSYGYVKIGHIFGANANGNEARISDNVPSFRIGDVVGCGLNWATRQLFFTKNGQRLDIDNLYNDEETVELYPTVTLYSHGDTVEANFGPNFQYDLSKQF